MLAQSFYKIKIPNFPNLNVPNLKSLNLNLLKLNLINLHLHVDPQESITDLLNLTMDVHYLNCITIKMSKFKVPSLKFVRILFHTTLNKQKLFCEVNENLYCFVLVRLLLFVSNQKYFSRNLSEYIYSETAIQI